MFSHVLNSGVSNQDLELLPVCLEIAEHKLFKFTWLRQVVAPFLEFFGVCLGFVWASPQILKVHFICCPWHLIDSLSDVFIRLADEKVQDIVNITVEKVLKCEASSEIIIVMTVKQANHETRSSIGCPLFFVDSSIALKHEVWPHMEFVVNEWDLVIDKVDKSFCSACSSIMVLTFIHDLLDILEFVL